MIVKDWKWLAALTLVVSACGGGGQDDDEAGGDAGPPGFSDGGDPSDSTRDIAGGWQWSATRQGENGPFVSCAVTIGGGAFDVTCPQGQVPRPAGHQCLQLRDDLHIYGTLSAAVTGRLDGMQDTIVEYQGESCVSYGLTVGAPYPEPAFVQLSAVQQERVGLGDFLADLGGHWVWTIDNKRSVAADYECAIDVSLAVSGGLGVDVAIACTSASWPVGSDCLAERVMTIAAHLAPRALTGTITGATRHEGEGCSPDLPADELSATMQAAPVEAE